MTAFMSGQAIAPIGVRGYNPAMAPPPSDPVSIPLADEGATASLGERLALLAQAGDLITLSGPLGSGKTVLARAFVRARLGTQVDVASPTFTLVNIYDQVDPPIWHVDLYRIDDPAETEALGLEDGFATGITLIEWPERAGSLLPDTGLTITLSAADGDARTATLAPGPTWTGRLDALRGIGVS